jgi:hypothetical protein
MTIFIRFLQDHDETSLSKVKKSDLVELCAARGIVVDSSKPELVKSLLHWVSQLIASSA